jgi:type IV pilus assembly protein PilF
MGLWLFLLTGVIVTGCASRGEYRTEDDTTGYLGADKRESPAAIYVEMGIAYLRDGQPAVAMKKLKKAIAVDPQNAEAYNVMAILYERLGKPDLAEENYAKAVALQPKDPFIRNARGSFFCKRERYAAAEQEFKNALNNPLYPTPWVAMTNAGLCMERAGDAAAAETYYREALTANETYFQALYQMARLSFEQGNHLSARAYLERFNAVADATAASLWLGVRIERQLGDSVKARDYGSRLIEKFPDAPEVQSLRQMGW